MPATRRARRTLSLPNEHGFWVMLLASVLSAEVRSGFTPVALLAGAALFAGSVLFASAFHRQLRGKPSAQLVASAVLAAAGALVEAAAGLEASEVGAGALGRLVLFVASALLVRAAFARSSRIGAARSARFELFAVAGAFAAALLLALLRQFAEAGACALTGLACIAIARAHFTTKQLKPLGLSLAGLAIAASSVLAI